MENYHSNDDEKIWEIFFKKIIKLCVDVAENFLWNEDFYSDEEE